MTFEASQRGQRVTPRPPDLECYGFVDLTYLLREYHDWTQAVYQENPDPSIDRVYQDLGAGKLHFYDGLPASGEIPDIVNDIRGTRNCHFRAGSVRRSRGQEQKEVDVLLAVDAMTHAANRTMKRAIIVAGDLDFRPLIQALLSLGIYVTLYASPRSCTHELTWTPDVFHPITVDDLVHWSDVRWLNPMVDVEDRGVHRHDGDVAQVADSDIGLLYWLTYVQGGNCTYFVELDGYNNQWRTHDHEVLKRFMDYRFKKPLEWRDPTPDELRGYGARPEVRKLEHFNFYRSRPFKK